MHRRDALKTILALPAATWAALGAAEEKARGRELRVDLVVAGGGLGGCAAALAACRAGLRVAMTEETDWVGGQSTAQAVPPDEHPWIESFGCTRSYRRYRDAIRAYYRDHYPLSPEARADGRLNPGSGWVSRICHEPRTSLAVLRAMLAPYRSGRRLLVLEEHVPVAAETAGDRVLAVAFRDLREGREVVLSAPWFIDATELGDLLPLAGAEHVVGAEGRRDTGEPHAPPEADPGNQQAFTCPFAIDWLEGEDHVISRPAEYGFWRAYVPELAPPWPGRLLSWRYSHPATLEPTDLAFDPTMRAAGTNLWAYRRIADAANFAPGTYPGGISLVNWPQNDYLPGALIGVSPEERARHIARAKGLSLSLLHWMQTEAPRPDGGAGWKGLRLREDIVGTADGLSKAPYIRESRRIRAEFTVLETHVGTEARMAETGKPRDEVRAASFPDSVGIGAYRIDLHPSTGGDNYIDTGCLPFQIPLGALIPQRLENLIPGAKDIGTTHITNGAYRLHPVEWNIGEAAGELAAFCRERKVPPRGVRGDPKLLAEFQGRLRADGFELEWPAVRPL